MLNSDILASGSRLHQSGRPARRSVPAAQLPLSRLSSSAGVITSAKSFSKPFGWLELFLFVTAAACQRQSNNDNREQRRRKPWFEQMSFRLSLRQKLTSGADSIPDSPLEHLRFFKSEHTGDNRGRETADTVVILPDRFVVVPARDINPVFGAFELGLQVDKILVCFQIGVVFGNREQP